MRSVPNGVSVAEVGVGDAFVWCDREVTVHHIMFPVKQTKRPARYLMCEEPDGTRHRLHYYDNEQVALVTEGSVTAEA